MRGKVGEWRKRIMCGYAGTFDDWLLEQRDEAFDSFYTVQDVADEVGAPVRSLYSALSRAGIKWPVGPNRALYPKRRQIVKPKWCAEQMEKLGFDHIRQYLEWLAKDAAKRDLSMAEVARPHGITGDGLDYHLQKWDVEWPETWHTRSRLAGLRKAGKQQKGRYRKLVEFKGERIGFTELCRRYKMHPTTVAYRVRSIAKGGAGMTLEEALTTPRNARKRLPPALRKRNAELRNQANATS